jgi:hypothetical protein
VRDVPLVRKGPELGARARDHLLHQLSKHRSW